MGYKQGIKSLKILRRNKLPIVPVDWVAGMDYNEELEDKEDRDYMPTEDNLKDKANSNMDKIRLEEIDQ